MTKSAAAELYEADFVRWTEQQSAALREAGRAGTNLPLDWENLAEEVESLGRSWRREMRSRIRTIIEHMLELEHSPASEPRPGWMNTIGRERSEIESLFADAPTLRRDVAGMIAEESRRAAQFAARELAKHGEPPATIALPNYTEEQILGDWFPEAPKPAPRPSSRARRAGASRGRA
jgi:hypothetical protein